MSKGAKLILLIVGGLIVVTLIILLLVRGGGTNEQVVNNNQNGSLSSSGSLPSTKRLIINDNTATGPVTKENASSLSADQLEEVDLERLSLSIAERFGSYSNQSGFDNIKDLQPLMTSEVKTWTDKMIAQGLPNNKEYWGVTTRAMSIKSREIAADKAALVVSTQRQETSADPNKSKVYKQDLKIEFTKTSGQWLISGLFWL